MAAGPGLLAASMLLLSAPLLTKVLTAPSAMALYWQGGCGHRAHVGRFTLMPKSGTPVYEGTPAEENT